MEIFKTFNGATEADLKGAAFKILIPWEVLNPKIEEVAHLRPWESIKGYVVSEFGVEVIVGQKPGPKKLRAINDTPLIQEPSTQEGEQ